VNPKTLDAGPSLEGFLAYLADSAGDVFVLYVIGVVATAYLARYLSKRI
jgi:hypothetical protein